MKKTTYFKSILLSGLAFFSLSSCDDNDDDGMETMAPTEFIVTIAQNETTLSSLVAALGKADENSDSDLITTLNSSGPFTVFAPTNAAFTNLLESLDDYSSLADFSTEEDRAILATILQYHVISGVAAGSDVLSNGQELTTVQGEKLTVNLSNGVSILDAIGASAMVTTANVAAKNGIVHIIDRVLLPQEAIDAINAKDIVELVVETPSLSLLEAAVIKADLVGTLASEGPFTVFAPTDDAFVALLDVLGDDYNSLDDFNETAEIALLKNILLYHVVPGKVMAADLAAGDVATALTDNALSVIADGSGFVIGDASETNANITAADIMATNGVVHTIDKVLLPQEAIDFVTELNMKTIVELAVETDDLSVLVAALQQADADLVNTLNGDGPFTVFAPTNAAFTALLAALGDNYNALTDFDTDEEKAILAKVLLYHVASGNVLSSTLTNGQEIPTVQGESITVVLNNGVFLDDKSDANAEVTMADVEASNGVVHIINKVLLPQEALDYFFPPQPTITALAQSVDALSTLVAALIQADAGLVELLNSNGTFTVFAPTNAAFTALLNDLGSDYNSLADFDTDEEKALLEKILKYHVVTTAAVASSALTDGMSVATAQTESLVINIANGTVTITDKTTTAATVTGADNMASNGIVHVIDKVLLPQEVIDAL